MYSLQRNGLRRLLFQRLLFQRLEFQGRWFQKLFLQTVLSSFVAASIVLVYHSGLEATPLRSLLELADNELFTTEDLTCGKTPAGWTSGKIIERNGKFRPKSVRLRTLRKRVRTAEGKKQRKLRR